MDTYIVLYKDGVASPPLHPVDANGWISNGWATEKLPPQEENKKAIVQKAVKSES
jgi:hypothetical protein